MDSTGTLHERDRRRGLVVMLADTFLMWAGFFMVIPLISVYYVDTLAWAAGAVGVVLGVRQVTQQGLTLLGGALADRMGARGLIAVGMVVRAASFFGMAFATTYPLLLLTAVLAALGGALFDSPSSAAIAALTRPADRSRYFSLLGVVRGLGLTIGPVLGALLLRYDFAAVALVAGGCFLAAFLVTLLFMPVVQVASERHDLTYGVRLALADRRFMLFNLLLMGYWFMWVQLTIALPLAARAISGTPDAVSWVYALNAVMSMALQYPLMRLAERWLPPLPILALGVAIMALGLGGVALAGGVAGLLACVAVFSLGTLLASPSQQTVTADLANPAALGSYFGVNALALAFGGGIGNVSGGLLYGLGRDMGVPWLPWLVVCAVGLSSALGLWLMHGRLARRAAQAAMV
ncbi:MAG TPA: MFS transporter [Roseiflexaceae bacterium]|nr:MFS transporter [Roseiflexaceae bacterium]